MDAGLVPAYPPPREVTGLVFLDDDTLHWDPEPSVGVYNLYRDTLPALPEGGYGSCDQQGLTTTGATDVAPPPGVGDGYFYLVTAENRLAEEGTKGFDTGAVERQGNACP